MWQDHLNVVDLCIVWGDNVATDAYRSMRFTNGTFTCYFAPRAGADMSGFSVRDVSNNHLLAENRRVVERLRDVRVGDQVRIEGFLAEYSHSAQGAPFSRGTSTTRDDTGNGACETIWVAEVRTLRRANAGWRAVLVGGWIAALLACLVWPFLPARRLD